MVILTRSDTIYRRVLSGQRALQDIRGHDAASPWSSLVALERGCHPSLGSADLDGAACVRPVDHRDVRRDRHGLGGTWLIMLTVHARSLPSTGTHGRPTVQPGATFDVQPSRP
jgi:hypothetical protein